MLIPAGDIDLYVEVDGTGPPVLFLHGFLGNGSSWNAIVEALKADYTCIRMDLPGHGRSGAVAGWERYTVGRQVEDVIRVLDTLALRASTVVGYSMGGRIALALALEAPEQASALILESASPGIEDQQEREERLAADDALAHVIETEGMAAFVDRWEELPLFATQKRLPPDARQRIRDARTATDPRGAAGSLRGMSPGRMPEMWSKLAGISHPALMIAGAEDRGYSAMVARMHVLMPASGLAAVPRVGHCVHVENPRDFTAAVRTFLQARHSPGAGRAG